MEKGSLSIGLIPETQFKTDVVVGKRHGYGLRSDGKLFSPMNSVGVEWSFCSSWGNVEGDIVGCGVLVDTGEIFFTKGTESCGVAFTLPPHVRKSVFSKGPSAQSARERDSTVSVRRERSHRFVPSISIGANRRVQVNFGWEKPFSFDIASYVNEKRKEDLQKMQKIPVSDSLVQSMIAEYLLFHGYGNTFEALHKAANMNGLISRETYSQDKSSFASGSNRNLGSDTEPRSSACPQCSFQSFSSSEVQSHSRHRRCKCCLHAFTVSKKDKDREKKETENLAWEDTKEVDELHGEESVTTSNVASLLHSSPPSSRSHHSDTERATIRILLNSMSHREDLEESDSPGGSTWRDSRGIIRRRHRIDSTSGRDNRRGLTLDDTYRMRRRLRDSEESTGQDEDARNDFRNNKFEKGKKDMLRRLHCLEKPDLAIDASALPVSVSDPQYQNLQDSLALRSELKCMLKEKKVKEVIRTLEGMEAGKSDMRRSATSLKATPTWIYLNVLLFLQLLLQDRALEPGSLVEEKTEHCLQESKSSESEDRQGCACSSEVEIDDALKIARKEFLFLLQPAGDQKGHYYRCIEPGRLRNTQSDEWHVWYFHVSEEERNLLDQDSGHGKKKRVREHERAGEDTGPAAVDSSPSSSFFVCSSFEYSVLKRLVMDVLKLLAAPPQCLKKLQCYYHQKASSEKEMDVSSHEKLKSTTCSDNCVCNNPQFVESLRVEYFLSSQFVDIVADSVNQFVLQRHKQTHPSRLHDLPHHHTALELCATQLRSLQGHSTPSASSSSKEATDLYNTHPVVWPKCHCFQQT